MDQGDNAHIGSTHSFDTQSKKSEDTGYIKFAAQPQCKKPRPDTNSLSARQYLDQTIGPILLHGLQALARERPTDAVGYLAAYLLKNKHRVEGLADNDAN